MPILRDIWSRNLHEFRNIFTIFCILDEDIQNSLHSNGYSNLNTRHQKLKRKSLQEECHSQLPYNSTGKIDSQTQTDDTLYLVNFGDPSLFPKPTKIKRTQAPEVHTNHIDNRAKTVSSIKA